MGLFPGFWLDLGSGGCWEAGSGPGRVLGGWIWGSGRQLAGTAGWIQDTDRLKEASQGRKRHLARGGGRVRLGVQVSAGSEPSQGGRRGPASPSLTDLAAAGKDTESESRSALRAYVERERRGRAARQEAGVHQR